MASPRPARKRLVPAPTLDGAVPAEHLDDLKARAKYARERYQLYRARAHGQRPTSLARLQELQREAEQAAARLRFAEAEQRRAGERPPVG